MKTKILIAVAALIGLLTIAHFAHMHFTGHEDDEHAKHSNMGASEHSEH